MNFDIAVVEISNVSARLEVEYGDYGDSNYKAAIATLRSACDYLDAAKEPVGPSEADVNRRWDERQRARDMK